MSKTNAENPSNNNAAVDELFDAKSSFYIGAFSRCLAEIQRLAKFNSLEKDCLMWRALIAQRMFRQVIDGIRDAPASGADPLQALRRLAVYRASIIGQQTQQQRAAVIDWFDEHQRTVLGADTSPDAPGEQIARVQWLCAAASVYYAEGQYETALKLLHGRAELECLALAVQTLLRMQRPDLARQHHARMQTADDDATLTQLAGAWLAIETGGDRLQDAYHVYTDLADRHQSATGPGAAAAVPALLLNGQAVCLIGQQRYEEADAVLRSALDRDASDYDALVNALVLAQLWDGASVPPSAAAAASAGATGEPWQLQQLRDTNVSAPLLGELDRVGRVFDALCADSGSTLRRFDESPVAV